MNTLKLILLVVILAVAGGGIFFHLNSVEKVTDSQIILNAENYHDHNLPTISDQLINRINIQPLNLIATIIFVLAIIHTLLANMISTYAKKLQERKKRELKKHDESDEGFHNRLSIETFGIEMLKFMGEIEVIFGLWIIPLLITMTLMYDWKTAVDYLSSRNYVEPLFVVVMMSLASTAPVVKLSENLLSNLARWGGDTVKAWWFVLLMVGSLLGSFITEPAAMTLTALLLIKQFYRYKPSQKFAYATLGLLFTNISVGGVLTNFSAPPVLMVARVWEWDTLFMFKTFGIKAIIGIFIATIAYGLMFKNEFKKMQMKKMEMLKNQEKDAQDIPIPLWIMLVNIFFLIWIVFHSHYIVVFLGTFVLFLGFYKATEIYQKNLDLKLPILVGFFLASLVVHGSLQGWWIESILNNVHHNLLMLIAIVLTAFNDNASITYLASLNPNLDAVMKYSLMVGAIVGGGLTVIANAPNPAGQSLLSNHFTNGISPLKLFFGAFLPTVIMLLSFYLLR